MGTQYSTVAITGYNSSPPPDDGTVSASNLVTWAGIKTKLADPVKTAVEAINTALVAYVDFAPRLITTGYSALASDHLRTIEIAPNVSSTVATVTLADAATMTNVYRVFVKNNGSVNQTIARATGANTIDGTAADITLPPKAGVLLGVISAATGYQVLSRTGPFLDTNPLVAGSSDGSKGVRFEVDTNVPTGTTVALTVPGTDDTLVGRATTDTLTNKTITGGTMTQVPITQNSQSAAYTTVLGDSGKHILHPVADNNARTFTIDSNANVAYPIGTVLTFVNEINTVTIAITTDTLTFAADNTTGSRTLAAGGIATALKITSTKWIISGAGLT